MNRPCITAVLAIGSVALGVLCIAGAVAAGEAAATPDIIGIYFDSEASSNCVSLPTGLHTAYLIVSNLSDPSGLSGWECMILTDGPIEVTGWGLLNNAINVYPIPQFGVGLQFPIPRLSTMPLMEISFFLSSTEQASFYIHPVFFPSLEGVPVYASGSDPGDLRPLHQSTGGINFAVATINGDCALPAEKNSWGELKALYR